MLAKNFENCCLQTSFWKKTELSLGLVKLKKKKITIIDEGQKKSINYFKVEINGEAPGCGNLMSFNIFSYSKFIWHKKKLLFLFNIKKSSYILIINVL